MKKLIPQSIKNIYHLLRSVLAAVWFGFPARKLKVVGITGTDGKTTTAQMVTKILEKAGHKVALSSTINFKIGLKEWVNKSKFTTRDAWRTQKFIRQAALAGCDYLVLEVASHALDQHRLWGIKFDVAVITNVTREHLDYHKTIQNYRRAKRRLFQMLKPGAVAVANLEMEKPEEFLAICKECQKFGFYKERNTEESSRGRAANPKSQMSNLIPKDLKIIRAEDLRMGFIGSEFVLNNTSFNLKLVGDFNVENALAAISVGISQGIDLKICSRALGEIKKVPGRMDYVENERGLKIIVDYALTPDAMEKLGRLISEMISAKTVPQNQERGKSESLSIGKSRLIWVFGACGERDRGKRSLMGGIVSHYADYAIVTNEDPYGEDPQQIVDEVFSGIKNLSECEKAWRIMDRKVAIRKALKLAHPGDVVLVTGKGAEETMAIGKKRIKWNDKAVIKELLREE